MIQDLIATILADIQPMLAAAGRSIEVKEASDTNCVIVLKGFCTDCACSESYKEGVEQMIREQMPQMKEIEFELV